MNKTTRMFLWEEEHGLMAAMSICGGFAGDEYCEDEDLVLRAWQYLVDTGVCWNLPGSFGRQAASLLYQGLLVVDED